ncbi:MAG TPA: response regulator [Mucilaginibacter sp.]|nr:response regulator [Mucilaginibacter sp.]
MKKVLIIEDDADTADVLQHIVENIGLEVITSRREIPLTELKKLDPSLILLDHWLESGYGADYCREIKDNPQTNHIPVIIISFIATLKEISEKAYADDYVSKPFDVEHLESLVAKFTA